MPTFETVLAAEHGEVSLEGAPTSPKITGLVAGAAPATAAPPVPTKPKTPTVGLALSGGGIRSATFNLGILQGLAKAKLLGRIDYLSTVSGGGFIGGWLISWIKRAADGVTEVQNKLGDYENHRDPNGPAAEPKQVNYLREYSNYLTPRVGVFGADTWAGIATYFRNVLLNQIVLIAFLGSIILFPWTVVRTSNWVAHHFPLLAGGWFAVYTSATIAMFLMLLGICFASAQTARCSLTKNKPPKLAPQFYVLILTVAPVFLSGLFTLLALWLVGNVAKDWPWYWWIAAGAVVYGVIHFLGTICRQIAIKASKQADARLTRDQWIGIPLSAFIAGGVGGGMLGLLDKLILIWRGWGHGFPHLMTWGPGLIIGAFLLTGSLHIGFLKQLIQNEEQEWWGRAGGLLLLVSVGWTSLFMLSIFVPWLLKIWGGWAKTKIGLVIGWALTTAAGVLSGKSAKTSGKGNSGDKDNSEDKGGRSPLETVALVSPYVFIIGLSILLSFGSYRLVEFKLDRNLAWKNAVKGESDLKPAEKMTVAVDLKAAAPPATIPTSGVPSAVSVKGDLTVTPTQQAEADQQRRLFWKRVYWVQAPDLWGKVGTLILLALLVAWRVDINLFSMNLLYRNRLVRCYLGASRPDSSRFANPFTGFDPEDDLSLAEFRRNPAAVIANAGATDSVTDKPYTGPYPILCAALNVTHGERLAWQERKAESFVFTPAYCGYQYSEMHTAKKTSDPGGFRETKEYAYPLNPQDPFHAKVGGVHLGTAISISGAAASPNMGFHTSPPLAFLMTVFNVRLGWWLANPRYTNEQITSGTPEGGPPCSLIYLLKELFASTSDLSDYVYLSDGGHFENLAIYELVRRRCKYIIACDADADGDVTFGDLGNAIRKCRSDFGVEITLDTEPLRPNAETGLAAAHGVIGTVQYPQGMNGEPAGIGHILYIKPAVTEDVPRDILAYRDTHSPFPYETTADQWFDESQFESYRKLGLHSFQKLCHGDAGGREQVDLTTFFAALAG